MSMLPKPKSDISPKAKALVDILVSEGCSIKEASERAGYKGTSARVSGHRQLQKPEVQEYLQQRVMLALGTHSAKAVSKLLHLSQASKSEYVQLEASKDILDRAGYKAPDKHQHLVAGQFSINIDLG